ncbi:MAG TPA: acylphosphatase [Stenotrophobium sp.]|nr:acylphosphatase [Stenotrophobium sp.]
MTRQCYRFIVSGHVQGVFFRQSSAGQARQLGIDGWVRNLADGRVEGVACGSADALRHYRAWLAQGPEAARVDDLRWSVCDEVPAQGFTVRR